MPDPYDSDPVFEHQADNSTQRLAVEATNTDIALHMRARDRVPSVAVPEAWFRKFRKLTHAQLTLLLHMARLCDGEGRLYREARTVRGGKASRYLVHGSLTRYTPHDLRVVAGISEASASEALTKLRRLGILGQRKYVEGEGKSAITRDVYQLYPTRNKRWARHQSDAAILTVEQTHLDYGAPRPAPESLGAGGPGERPAPRNLSAQESERPGTWAVAPKDSGAGVPPPRPAPRDLGAGDQNRPRAPRFSGAGRSSGGGGGGRTTTTTTTSSSGSGVPEDAREAELYKALKSWGVFKTQLKRLCKFWEHVKPQRVHELGVHLKPQYPHSRWPWPLIDEIDSIVERKTAAKAKKRPVGEPAANQAVDEEAELLAARASIAAARARVATASPEAVQVAIQAICSDNDFLASRFEEQGEKWREAAPLVFSVDAALEAQEAVR